MDSLHSRYRFLFYSSLSFILLLGNVSVNGWKTHHPLNRHQPSSENHLYPKLDFSQLPRQNVNSNQNKGHNTTYYPTIDFSRFQIDPGFNPSYYKRGYNGTLIPTINLSNQRIDPGFAPYRINGHNVTYYPNFNFANSDPIAQPNRNQGHNFSFALNNNNNYQYKYQHTNHYPNSNSSNINVHNNYENRPADNLILQNNLPIPRTTCGKTLCSYVPNYPTKEISSVVDRARNILRSGITNESFRNKGINLQHFDSKKYSSRLGNNTTAVNLCKTNTNAIYPHEGFSSDDSNTYYIVNIPNLDQTITNMECNSNGQTCSQRIGVPISETRSCQQLYRKEQLLALPFGIRNFDVNDFQLRTFYIPSDCICMFVGGGYSMY